MMKLQASDWLAVAALLVSIVSLGISLYATLLDRIKIKAFSTLYKPHELNPHTWIEVKVVNHGRRTAVLTMFGGDIKGGGWQGSPLSDRGLGLHLAENEFHKLDLTPEQVFFVGRENDEEYVDLWFEDSQGRRHRVKNARKHLQEMKKI
jgi:hypothetical protein